MTRSWPAPSCSKYAIQKPYRLSVNYEVRVVNLDSTEERRDEVVQSRELDSDRLVNQP